MSDFKMWPEAGGLLDQSWEWVEDIITYLALERRYRWEHSGDMEYDKEPLELGDLG